MTTANNQENNLSPWQPGQSGNPSGRPSGTRGLAGYVLEATDGGKELVDALVSIARGVMPNVPAQEGSRPRKDQQVRPADQLLSSPASSPPRETRPKTVVTGFSAKSSTPTQTTGWRISSAAPVTGTSDSKKTAWLLEKISWEIPSISTVIFFSCMKAESRN